MGFGVSLSHSPLVMLYFVAVGAVVVILQLLSMWFAHGLGLKGAGSDWYAGRALLGLDTIPTRGLRFLAVVLRALTVVCFLGQVGAIYLTFSIGSSATECDACQFDLHGKSPLFWAAFILAIIASLVPSLMNAMVLRVDPRQMEAQGRFDTRRIKMGLRWIFQDRPMRNDAIATVLRQLCRWLILIGILDALAIVGLMAMK